MTTENEILRSYGTSFDELEGLQEGLALKIEKAMEKFSSIQNHEYRHLDVCGYEGDFRLYDGASYMTFSTITNIVQQDKEKLKALLMDLVDRSIQIQNTVKGTEKLYEKAVKRDISNNNSISALMEYAQTVFKTGRTISFTNEGKRYKFKINNDDVNTFDGKVEYSVEEDNF